MIATNRQLPACQAERKRRCFIHITSIPQHHLARWTLLPHFTSDDTEDQKGWEFSFINYTFMKNMNSEIMSLSSLDGVFDQNDQARTSSKEICVWLSEPEVTRQCVLLGMTIKYRPTERVHRLFLLIRVDCIRTVSTRFENIPLFFRKKTVDMCCILNDTYMPETEIALRERN